MATGFYWVSYKTLIELKVKWLSEQFQVSNRFCSINKRYNERIKILKPIEQVI